MIVRDHGASLLLITQPDHAALARRIMDHWVAGDFARAPRRASILHAIDAHDDGWRELDEAPIVDTTSGRIADFITAPAEVRRAVWPRGVARLADDPWAAALVAEHAIYIYGRYRKDAGWAPFFAEMERLRAQYVAIAQLTLEALSGDYLFLRIGDLLSLSFCNAWTDAQEDFDYSIRWEAPRVVIAPDPFGRASIPVSIRARELPNRPFRDAADAASAWRDARDVALSGSVSGPAETTRSPAAATNRGVDGQ